ncbi:hypothetical protein P8452_40431 [Trifolium repens]|nr:hypothetical protein P8452_40431 [Trifolium repens]
MSGPYGGRGRGRGRHGRGRGTSIVSLQESNIPLIGDWTTITYNKNKQTPRKEEASSSNSNEQNKLITYKDTVINNPEQVSEYFENPVTEKIMHVEHDDIAQANNNGWSIKTKYLDSRGYPGLYGKSRPNLEILLNVTESVTITHYYQGNNPENFINFSKCHINKILLPREWGFNPNGEKAIKLAEGKYIYFNYWDYVQAFTQVFYYQNPKNKHSWFFSINPNILASEIPNWFFEWWIKFGPSLEILPKELLELYNSWCDNSPLILKIASDNLITGQCPALFIIKFQIPWIWRWSLKISKDRFNIPILERNFFFKWWNKMSPEDVQNIVSTINNSIQEDNSKKLKGQNATQFSLDQMKTYFQKKYPNESEDEIMIRTLDHMKSQFLKIFPSCKEDTMSTSSQGSMDILAGESQSPTPEDFWDGLIEAVAQGKRTRG